MKPRKELRYVQF